MSQPSFMGLCHGMESLCLQPAPKNLGRVGAFEQTLWDLGVQEKFEVMDTTFYHYKMQSLEEILEMVCCQLASDKGGLEKGGKGCQRYRH